MRLSEDGEWILTILAFYTFDQKILSFGAVMYHGKSMSKWPLLAQFGSRAPSFVAKSRFVPTFLASGVEIFVSLRYMFAELLQSSWLVAAWCFNYTTGSFLAFYLVDYPISVYLQLTASLFDPKSRKSK